MTMARTSRVLFAGLISICLLQSFAVAVPLQNAEICGRVETALKGPREVYFRLEKQANGSEVIVLVICRTSDPDFWCRPTLSFNAKDSLGVQWLANGKLAVRSTGLPLAYQPEHLEAPRPDLVEFVKVDIAAQSPSEIASTFDRPGGVFIFGRDQCVFVEPFGDPNANSDLE